MLVGRLARERVREGAAEAVLKSMRMSRNLAQMSSGWMQSSSSSRTGFPGDTKRQNSEPALCGVLDIYKREMRGSPGRQEAGISSPIHIFSLFL